MKTYRATIIMLLLALVICAVLAVRELQALNGTINSIRSDIPMSVIGN